MRFGLAAGPLPSGLLYAAPIVQACETAVPDGFSTLVAYAIAFRETIRGQIAGMWNAATVVADDHGTGLFQVTPEAWWSDAMLQRWTSIDQLDPLQNASFAIREFLLPAETYWADTIGLTGDPLIKCMGDEYNAGRTAVIKAHALGNADAASTGDNYGSDIVAIYHELLAGKSPR